MSYRPQTELTPIARAVRTYLLELINAGYARRAAG